MLNHPDFTAAINHNALPELAQSWQKGRRFLVFAVDVQKAREKVTARYPERLGYRVVSLVPQTVPAPTPAKAPAAAPSRL
jgi:hypothetical protein